MNISVEDLPISPYSRSGKHRRVTKAIIMHYVKKAGQSAAGVRAYFASLADQTKAPFRYASAHYIIGLRGEIIRAVPEEEVAYHAGSSALDPASGKVYTDWARAKFGLTYTSNTLSPNYATIAVEMCHINVAGEYTKESIDSAIELVASLCRKYSLAPLTDVGRHYDVVGWKECPLYWVQNEASWFAFLACVDARVKELKHEEVVPEPDQAYRRPDNQDAVL